MHKKGCMLLCMLLVALVLLWHPWQSMAQSNDEREGFLRKVVVLGIYGFLGDSVGGIGEITNSIRNAFVRYGVPPENVQVRSWNTGDTNNPSADPNIDDLATWVRQHGTDHPSYYVLIGHSYGGWAAARLSDHHPPRIPDMLLTIDPVLGPANTSTVHPKARIRRASWRQTISALAIPPDAQCLGVDSGVCTTIWRGKPIAACGVNMPTEHDGLPPLENHRFDFVRTGNCEVKRICGIQGKQWRTAHTKIDEDACLREHITSVVVAHLYQQLKTRGWLPEAFPRQTIPSVK